MGAPNRRDKLKKRRMLTIALETLNKEIKIEI